MGTHFGRLFRVGLLGSVLWACDGVLQGAGEIPENAPPGTITNPPTTTAGTAIVFVSRQIPQRGSIYWDAVRDMPGVGAHSRFRIAAPGQLLVREDNGTLRTLVDGTQPTSQSLNLIDVNAPSASYDGRTIVFAGLPAGETDQGPATNPGAWRIYAIEADGTGLRAMTTSSQNLNLSQFGSAAGGLAAYDDTDPVFLPDGRICFTSTRYPGFGHYSGVRQSNLYVINANGTGLHRMTSERNGADRPLVDPLTGKIVFSRWWRNHRFPINSMATILADAGNPAAGYLQKDGLTSDRTVPVGGDSMFRNAWHPAEINPDGTGLAMWSGSFRDEAANHIYGGTFLPDGSLMANFFPMYNMTEAAGFGGLRRYQRGAMRYAPVMGITDLTLQYLNTSNPTSYGIFVGEYVGEPTVMPDGRLIVSIAPTVLQDYALYSVNPDGSDRRLVFDRVGTTELRAVSLAARPLPPIVTDSIVQVASQLPPLANGPYAIDGTFSFVALNVFANGPVDADIVNAPAVGSASSIRFFIDHQRTSPGSFPALDWPILLGEQPITPAGFARDDGAPANVSLFEQLRAPDGTVPLTGNAQPNGGAAHVAGLNYGRPGVTARCMGCHAGHTMIPVPPTDAEAAFSNLATGAQVTVSSTRDSEQNRGLIDRRVMRGEIWRYWTSANGQTNGQWVQLTFPVPVTVRTVRLYNPRSGGEANSSVQVNAATVRLYSDAGATTQVAAQSTGALAVGGTAVPFADVQALAVRVFIDSVSGTFYGAGVASLAEVEVFARGEAP
ncbi:MAG: TolB family protein [Myxococcaceae bacterium]